MGGWVGRLSRCFRWNISLLTLTTARLFRCILLIRRPFLFLWHAVFVRGIEPADLTFPLRRFCPYRDCRHRLLLISRLLPPPASFFSHFVLVTPLPLSLLPLLLILLLLRVLLLAPVLLPLLLLLTLLRLLPLFPSSYSPLPLPPPTAVLPPPPLSPPPLPLRFPRPIALLLSLPLLLPLAIPFPIPLVLALIFCSSFLRSDLRFHARARWKAVP